MQRRVIITNGVRQLVNVAGWEDGIGAGFATGQLVMKSFTDLKWYIVTTSGSSPSAAIYISQSALPFATSSFYDQNYPYQLVACNDGLAYKVYLTGTAPTVTLTISQSASGPAYITSSTGARIDIAKPNLLLQSISDFNYYQVTLNNSASVITAAVNQTMISQSWVKPIY